ncbi:hypothetical protein Tco_0149954 [Tanacetum coccineum]
MSPAPPTTATPVASHHQHHRYPSPHHPHRLHLAIISPTRKPPSPPPPRQPRRHHQEGCYAAGFITHPACLFRVLSPRQGCVLGCYSTKGWVWLSTDSRGFGTFGLAVNRHGMCLVRQSQK